MKPTEERMKRNPFFIILSPYSLYSEVMATFLNVRSIFRALEYALFATLLSFFVPFFSFLLALSAIK